MEFQGAKKLQFCDCHSEPAFKILCYASLSPSPNPPLTHSTVFFFFASSSFLSDQIHFLFVFLYFWLKFPEGTKKKRHQGLLKAFCVY